MLVEIEGIPPVVANVLLIGLISIIFFVFFSKGPNNNNNNNGQAPQPNDRQGARGGVGSVQNQRTDDYRQTRQRPQTNNHTAGATATAATAGSSSSIAKVGRTPPHISVTSAERVAATASIPLSSEGLVPFRHCRASVYESSGDFSPDTQTANRKERARLLSRILSLDKSAPPPPRGSTVVVSIESSQIGFDGNKLQRVLYLLATFFNLIVILSVKDRSENVKDLIGKLRSGTDSEDHQGLPAAVLPDHRIVASQTLTGRVAIVRQLGSVEFVLDHEEEMRRQLTRFGFRVFAYGSFGKDDPKNSSSVPHLSALLG